DKTPVGPGLSFKKRKIERGRRNGADGQKADPVPPARQALRRDRDRLSSMTPRATLREGMAGPHRRSGRLAKVADAQWRHVLDFDAKSSGLGAIKRRDGEGRGHQSEG